MRDMSAPLSAALLAWYDRHARVMPWRVAPQDRATGVLPDPYRVWLSEIMLQQTTVAAVRAYFLRFTERWPTVGALAAAADADVMAQWAGLGYYARARNLLKGARAVVADHGGVFPATTEALLTLPGVGPYTAAAVAAIAYDAPVAVVDGNVERVMARLFAVQDPLPRAKQQLTSLAARLTPTCRSGDYAQAVMDLGATICTPRNPACGICPWAGPCDARKAGIQADLPRKLPKPEKPTRLGIAYVVRRADGAWLLERRPDKGLLGGMLCWPGSDWGGQTGGGQIGGGAPMALNWQEVAGEVRHTFTHFHLRLSIKVAGAGLNLAPDRGEFLPAPNFRPADMPTVMRKVFDLAQSAFVPHCDDARRQ